MINIAQDQKLGWTKLRIIPEADNKIIDVLKIQNSVSRRNSYGGTAPKNVLKAAREAKKRFLKD